ncbi:transporter [Brevibacillus migulae]|uniref:transporter n=1 Tax=Brevibacillus migulae TaxID=1644114 RepID=UPI00106E4E7C|nr:transporter [Brevibacillus migulae]
MAFNFPGPPGGGNFPPPPQGPPPAGQQFFGRQQRQRRRFGSFRPCLFRFTFVWLRNGNQFWFYPVFIQPGGVAGYRWTGNRWRFYGLDTRRVVDFDCF